MIEDLIELQQYVLEKESVNGILFIKIKNNGKTIYRAPQIKLITLLENDYKVISEIAEKRNHKLMPQHNIEFYLMNAPFMKKDKVDEFLNDGIEYLVQQNRLFWYQVQSNL